jgi:hypothetical protein
MKLFYAGLVGAAMMVCGAAQAQTTVRGDGPFCMLDAAVANCSYASAQACQLELQRGTGEARRPVCIARSEVK